MMDKLKEIFTTKNIVIALTIIIVLAGIGIAYATITKLAWPAWTGFNDKTLWDVVRDFSGLIALVALIHAFLHDRTERLEDRQEYTDQMRESALQNYIDKIQELMVGENGKELHNWETGQSIARARTLVVLGGLNPIRKGILVQFLYESGLITSQETVIPLYNTDLGGVNLSGADLNRVNLSGAYLRWADLSGAYLNEAHLRWADLSRADLSRAILSNADLSGTHLFNANLRGANLGGADLSGANLGGANLRAADLTRANLREADLSRADLSGADLSRAILSNADLSGTNLGGADLSGANLGQAAYDNSTTWPIDFTPLPDAVKE